MVNSPPDRTGGIQSNFGMIMVTEVWLLKEMSTEFLMKKDSLSLTIIKNIQNKGWGGV